MLLVMRLETAITLNENELLFSNETTYCHTKVNEKWRIWKNTKVEEIRWYLKIQFMKMWRDAISLCPDLKSVYLTSRKFSYVLP
jgi:hypothetical protein